MFKQQRRNFLALLLLGDIVILLASFSFGYVIRSGLQRSFGRSLYPFKEYWWIGVLCIPIWIFLNHLNGLYRLERGAGLSREIWRIVRSDISGGVVLFFVLFALKALDISRSFLAIFLCAHFALSACWRLALRFILKSLRRRGKNLFHVIFMGWKPKAGLLLNKISGNQQWGIKPIGIFEDASAREQLPGDIPYLGAPGDLEAFLLHPPPIDQMIICRGLDPGGLEQVLSLCRSAGIEAILMEDMVQDAPMRADIEELFGFRVVVLGQPPSWSRVLKAGLDLALAAIILIVLSPFLALIAVGIKLTSPSGPVFYTQLRIGLQGRPFRIIKFRTMVPDAEKLKDQLMDKSMAEPPLFKVPNDPRITFFGRLLRRFSLDELPQLINVLKGDMSLVGPRPHDAREVEGYRLQDRARLTVRPGITGLCQVSGGSLLPFDQGMRMDLEYIERWSLLLDLAITAKTIPFLLWGKTIR